MSLIEYSPEVRLNLLQIPRFDIQGEGGGSIMVPKTENPHHISRGRKTEQRYFESNLGSLLLELAILAILV